MASLICAYALQLRESRAFWMATIFLSLTRIVMQIGLPKQAPKFLLDAALPAQLVTTLPELLILDPQWGVSLLGYFLSHAGTSAFLYHTTGVIGLPASICQGFGTHALCVFVFLAFRQSWKLLCLLGGLHSEDLPKAPEQLDQEEQVQAARELQYSKRQEEKEGKPAGQQIQAEQHQGHGREKEQALSAKKLQQVQAARELQYSKRQEEKEVKPAGQQMQAEQHQGHRREKEQTLSAEKLQQVQAAKEIKYLQWQEEKEGKPAGQQIQAVQHQGHVGEKEQTLLAEKLRHVQAAKELQYSPRQEEKERKHVDKGEQVSSASGAHAPHHRLSELPKPQFIPLSSANIAAAATTAAAEVGYKDNVGHRSPFQGGMLHGSKAGPHDVVAGKQRVLEQQQWECESLIRSDTDVSSVTLDSLRSMSRRSSTCSQSSVRSNSVSLKGSPALSPGSSCAEAMGPKRWVQSEGSMRKPASPSKGSKAMGLTSPPAKMVLTDPLSMHRSSSLSQSSACSNGTSLQAMMGLSSPHAKAVLADALKARVEGRQLYVSKRHKPPASGSKSSYSMVQYVQTACRFAVKVNGLSSPGNVPTGAVNQLQQRLSRYQCLVSAEAPAIRAGCLVISYGALLQAHSLQDMSKEAEGVGKAWAEESGLLSAEGSCLTVQACLESSWCSSSHGPPAQPNPLEHSLIVHEPFIEASPPNLEQESVCTFDLTLIAPAGFELRGWHGAADAPEDLADDVKDHSLSLLATIDGCFVHTSVQQHSQGSLGERLVQVQVSLPAGVFDSGLDFNSPLLKVLVLELWAAGSLVCSYSAITVPSLYTGALREMHDWVDQSSSSREESSAFMRDLVVWMYYQANNATLKGDIADESQQQLVLEAAVGLDLLGHSLQHGMLVLAGLLLIGLMSPPFSIPPSDHTKPQAPAGKSVATLDGGHDCSAAPAHNTSPSEQPRTKLAPAARQKGTQTTTPVAQQKGTQTTTPVAQPALRPANKPGAPSTRDVCPSTLAAATMAFFGAEEASPEEAEYRAWTNAQVARLARTWWMLWVLNMGLGALRMAWTKGLPPLLELSSWGVMLLGYSLGALFIQPGSPTSEVIIAATTLSRIVYGFTLGLGLVPMSPTLALVFHYRLEACIEAFMMSVMERVRPSWALALRALLTISTASFYARLGFPMPLVQSLVVNLCGLCVTAAIEWRDRRLYLSSRAHTKQQAFADEERLGQHAASSRSGKPKSS